MSDRKAWAKAFAEQARVDYSTFLHMTKQDVYSVPDCHRLEFLQMACEKVAKSALIGRGIPPGDLTGSHAHIRNQLPALLRAIFARQSGRPVKDRSDLINQFGHIARQIELLSPAVDDGGRRPDNCEYPWEDAGGVVRSPLSHDFPVLELIIRPAGIRFLELLPLAIDESLE